MNLRYSIFQTSVWGTSAILFFLRKINASCLFYLLLEYLLRTVYCPRINWVENFANWIGKNRLKCLPSRVANLYKKRCNSTETSVYLEFSAVKSFWLLDGLTVNQYFLFNAANALVCATTYTERIHGLHPLWVYCFSLRARCNINFITLMIHAYMYINILNVYSRHIYACMHAYACSRIIHIYDEWQWQWQ